MQLKNRIEISIRLEENESKRSIANKINKNKSLKLNSKCIELNKREYKEILETHPCSILKKSPYLCNGCPRYINNHCTYHYVIYDPLVANERYKELKSESNSNIDNNKKKIIEDIQKGLNLGQTITHIQAYLKDRYKDNMVSITTMYKWIDKGVLSYDKKVIKQKKVNEKKEKLEYKKRVDMLKNKEYEDYLKYIKNKNIETAEMDLVCGPIGT